MSDSGRQIGDPAEMRCSGTFKGGQNPPNSSSKHPTPSQAGVERPELTPEGIAEKISKATKLLDQAKNAEAFANVGNKSMRFVSCSAEMVCGDTRVIDVQLNLYLRLAIEERAKEYIQSCLAAAQGHLAEAAGAEPQ